MTAQRVAALVALALLVVASVGAVLADAAARKHRLKVPPRPAFPRAVSVDEIEYALNPSRTIISSGRVRIFAYNRGMDDHDIAVYDQAGNTVVAPVPLAPGGADEVTVTLPAGDYRVVCSLFAGTPASHELLGMKFTLTVQDPPRAQAVPPPALR
jgi:plastocyanin